MEKISMEIPLMFIFIFLLSGFIFGAAIMFVSYKLGYSGNLILTYIAISLAYGIVLSFLYKNHSFEYLFFILAAFTCVLFVVFLVDMITMLIPDILIIAAMIPAVIYFVFNIINPNVLFGKNTWYFPVTGIFAGAGTLFIISLIGFLLYKKPAMGGGDIKLFIPAGLILGPWLSFFALFISFMTGGIYAFYLIFTKKADKKSEIPFGPFLVSGIVISYLFGKNIILWYSSVFYR